MRKGKRIKSKIENKVSSGDKYLKKSVKLGDQIISELKKSYTRILKACDSYTTHNLDTYCLYDIFEGNYFLTNNPKHKHRNGYIFLFSVTNDDFNPLYVHNGHYLWEGFCKVTKFPHDFNVKKVRNFLGLSSNASLELIDDTLRYKLGIVTTYDFDGTLEFDFEGSYVDMDWVGVMVEERLESKISKKVITVTRNILIEEYKIYYINDEIFERVREGVKDAIRNRIPNPLFDEDYDQESELADFELNSLFSRGGTKLESEFEILLGKLEAKKKKLKNKIKRERQFKKQVELNSQIQDINKQITALKKEYNQE